MNIILCIIQDRFYYYKYTVIINRHSKYLLFQMPIFINIVIFSNTILQQLRIELKTQ